MRKSCCLLDNSENFESSPHAGKMTEVLYDLRRKWTSFHKYLIDEIDSQYHNYIDQMLSTKNNVINEIDEIYLKRLRDLDKSIDTIEHLSRKHNGNLCASEKPIRITRHIEGILDHPSFAPQPSPPETSRTHINGEATLLTQTNSESNEGSSSMLKCFYCDRTFANQESLDIHSLVHVTSKENPYLCMICHQRFNNKSDFASHEQAHFRPSSICMSLSRDL